MNKLCFTFLACLALGSTDISLSPAHAKLPPTLASTLAKGDFESLEKGLLAQIEKNAAGKNASDIYKDKELLSLLTLVDILQTTGSKNLTELTQKEKKYIPFFNAFFNDLDWMQLYLQAGLIPKDKAVSLRVLGDIWLAHGKDADFKTYLSLATGTAAAWGEGNFSPRLQAGESDTTGGKCDPVWRYNFFKEAHKAGKLHTNFINLKPWEIRFVSGGTWDDASLEYLQNTINIPPRRYGWACWRAEYTGTSEFGESIQGPLFYTPWNKEIGQAQKTVEHGGVCGALSHVGHTAAAARGIPSYPVGQPGHCAYGFRLERGKWEGGFGGPDGGPHNAIFPGPAPTSTRLMEEAFKDDDKVDVGYKTASIAKIMGQLGQTKTAKSAWKQSLRMLPHNMFLQQEFQDFALNNDLYTPEEWYTYATQLLAVHKTHGFAALETLKKILPKALEGASDEKKLEWFAMVQEALAQTPISWAVDITPILQEQKSSLDDIKSGELYLANLLNTHMNIGDGSNFGKVLEWAIENYVNSGQGEAFSRSFSTAVAQSGSSENKTDSSDDATKQKQDKMRDAFGKAIVAAENARSLSAVRAISDAAKEYQRDSYNAPTEAQLNLPEGKLVSDKGFLRLSTSSNWDSPCDHLNVLSLKGGAFHTDNEEKPEVIVQLAEPANVSSLLIVKNHGNEWRTKKMKISRSTDGATWYEMAATEDMPSQWRIDFPDAPAAKWIKIESMPKEKTPLHLSRILVFEKKN